MSKILLHWLQCISLLNLHLLEAHNQSKETTEVCEHCGKSFGSSLGLKYHVENQVCKVCQKRSYQLRWYVFFDMYMSSNFSINKWMSIYMVQVDYILWPFPVPEKNTLLTIDICWYIFFSLHFNSTIFFTVKFHHNLTLFLFTEILEA